MLNFGLGAVIPENEIIEKERYVNAACTKHVTYFELSCAHLKIGSQNDRKVVIFDPICRVNYAPNPLKSFLTPVL